MYGVQADPDARADGERKQKMKARLETVAANLARQEWIFAKTMPDNPHEYCL